MRIWMSAKNIFGARFICHTCNIDLCWKCDQLDAVHKNHNTRKYTRPYKREDEEEKDGQLPNARIKPGKPEDTKNDDDQKRYNEQKAMILNAQWLENVKIPVGHIVFVSVKVKNRNKFKWA